MDEADVVAELQELDLTAYQSRGYLAAVRLGTARPNDLANEADIPQARIYDVIDDLHDLGFVDVHEQAGGKEVSAPPPGTVLESYKQQHVREYTDRVDAIVDGLDAIYDDDTESAGFVSMVRLRESALRHVRQALEDAEYWVSLAVPRSIYGSIASDIEVVAERDVGVRLLLPDTVDLSTLPTGCAVRTRDLSEMLVAVDWSYGIYRGSVAPGDADDYVVARQDSLPGLLQDRFEQLWAGATEVQPFGALPRRYLDPWRAAADLGPRLVDDRLTVTVDGVWTRTDRTDTWTGTVVDSTWPPGAETEIGVGVPQSVELVLDCDGETYRVGGRHASDVDIAAHGLLVRTE